MNKYGTDQVTKRTYDVYIKSSDTPMTGYDNASSGADFTGASAVRIGALMEQPKFTTEKGEEIAIATGSKINLSQVANFECSIIEATDDNYQALRTLINKQSDIIFTDVPVGDMNTDNVPITNGVITNCTVSGKQAIMLRGFALFPALNIIGNDRNIINLVGSKETGKLLTTSDIIFKEGA